MFAIGCTHDLVRIPSELEIDNMSLSVLPVRGDSKQLLDYALNDQFDEVDFESQKNRISLKTMSYMMSVSLQRLQVMNRLAENLHVLEDRLMEHTSRDDVTTHTVLSVHQKLLDRLEKELSSYNSPENPTVNLFNVMENKIMNVTNIPGNSSMLNLLQDSKKEVSKSEVMAVEGRKKLNMLMDSIKGKL
jgi:hypothetical protein